MMYRPQLGLFSVFMDEFASLLDQYALFTSHQIILGDFVQWNIDTTSVNPNEKHFGSLLTQFDMQ